MGGFFGVTSKQTVHWIFFFGTDYHSHLGTRRGGMAVYGENGFSRSIHNIENSRSVQNLSTMSMKCRVTWASAVSQIWNRSLC